MRNVALMKARSQRADRITEKMLHACDRVEPRPLPPAETVEQFLARGGKIININVKKEVTIMSPKTTIKKGTAKDLAEHLNECNRVSKDIILAKIPEYANPLPRRSWLVNLRKNLKPELQASFDALEIK